MSFLLSVFDIPIKTHIPCPILLITSSFTVKIENKTLYNYFFNLINNLANFLRGNKLYRVVLVSERYRYRTE